jgi:hypothetical protein
MAGDPDVQSIIEARLAGRSRTDFTAAEITKAMHDKGVHTSEVDVAAALDALVDEGKLKRRTRHAYWRFADESGERVTLYRAKARFPT